MQRTFLKAPYMVGAVLRIQRKTGQSLCPLKSKSQIMRSLVDFLKEFGLHLRALWTHPFMHWTNFIEHVLCARHVPGSGNIEV